MNSERLKDAWTLHERFLANSDIEPGTIEDIRFLTLALAGEVGELANMIKKEWRGDTPDFKEIAGEVVDVAIYLDLLIEALNLTNRFDELIDGKLEVIKFRLAERGL